ncbi:division/cell wall cluster transcriptional repressor MraZ [Roseospirillum parvum]|uniref:Transcriptional regulator MraZ n=1 Tax=Roseospirillum parvum TaxID=83401 RepID=A0A1G7UCM0_9PROT|nr:division/cell wall cluster transcriptional repressor MraZ [Roseospirillum parvum]SDG45098.1 MraZ protein [Roseospirillum parvum]
MKLFLSTTVNKVDRKGRVSVPAGFRTVLAANTTPGVFVFPSFHGACIMGVGSDEMERLADGTESFAAFSPEHEDAARLIFGATHHLNWDETGRILLPAELREHAGIDDQAAFVGVGKRFEIWHPERHREARDTARQRAVETKLSIPMPGSGGAK